VTDRNMVVDDSGKEMNAIGESKKTGFFGKVATLGLWISGTPARLALG
jgi:hypothetical protein